MKRLTLAILPIAAMLTACGPSNDIVLTNDNNVVLNDAHTNYASVNDGEVPANDMAPANDAMPAHDMGNGDMGNMAM
jgi:uncharacterized protein YcfL